MKLGTLVKRRERSGKRVTIPPRALLSMFLSAVALTVALSYSAPFFYRYLTTPTYDNALFVFGYKDRLFNYATHETLKSISFEGDAYNVITSKAGRRLDEIIAIYNAGEDQTLMVALLSGILGGMGLVIIWIQAYAREKKGRSTGIVAILLVGAAVFLNWTNVSLRSAKDIKAHEIAQPFVQGDMAILSFSSIHQNASELLSSLMNRGAPHDALDLERNSYFHHAAEFGRTKMLVILASYPDVELNSQNELGQTPVQIATEKGYVESVEFFLKRGIDASNEDAEGRTLLHRAAANEDAPMLELLLKYTQGLNELDDNGISPLSLAADRLNLDTITMLLDSDADVNSLVDDASTFFEAALVGILNTAQSKEAFTAEDETRVIDLTRRMLEMDADLTRRNAEGETPLHWVTDAHDTVYDGTDNDSLLSALTALLVEYDAPTSAENDDDVQALPLAHVIRHGYDQWLEQVIDANLASLNSITIEKTTLFQYAVEYGDAKTLAMLFDKGMKTKPWSPKSIDPLKYLIEKNDLATARILLEQGYAKPKESAIPIDGPLHLAARLNLAQMIELLLEFGYDVNVPGSRGNTPLHDAVTTKSTFAILTLVENDADPLIWNSDALTPMQRARDLGNPSVLDVLKRAVREKQSK